MKTSKADMCCVGQQPVMRASHQLVGDISCSTSYRLIQFLTDKSNKLIIHPAVLIIAQCLSSWIGSGY